MTTKTRNISGRGGVTSKTTNACRLAADPAFIEAFDSRRKTIISEMELLVMDGSKQANRKAVELVKDLQAANKFKNELYSPIRAERLRQREDK